MGMFDTIVAECPDCKSGNSIEFQTKAGHCVLDVFDYLAVPEGLAWDIKNDVQECYLCKKSWGLKKDYEYKGLITFKIIPKVFKKNTE